MALQSWQQALSIYKKIHNHSGEMSSLRNLGVTYEKVIGDYAKAIRYLQQSLTIARELREGKEEEAEMVVLSACNTGRGRITSDGVIGLSRSLFAAGVPSVVVSLWSVDSESTAFLMKKFYQYLPSGKAARLRQAMLETMKQYPNPRDWAAFTLIGES